MIVGVVVALYGLIDELLGGFKSPGRIHAHAVRRNVKKDYIAVKIDRSRR